MTVLVIDETHRAASRHRSARRRPSSHPQPKHASARATCLEHPRRNHRDVFPQVGSGVRPFAAGCRVGSQSYNDPTNKTDPTGLRPHDCAASRLTFRFPVDGGHRWLGQIEVAGFIPQDETSLAPNRGPGPRYFAGDDRTWTEPGRRINADRGRFYVSLDFSTGNGTVQVNPTQRIEHPEVLLSPAAGAAGGSIAGAAGAAETAFGDWGRCSPGLPITYGAFDGNNPFSSDYKRNYVGMQRSGDTYRFKWSVVHADLGAGQDLFRARADGNLDFEFKDGGVDPVSWTPDPGS